MISAMWIRPVCPACRGCPGWNNRLPELPVASALLLSGFAPGGMSARE
jgi:hypothetical protein